MSKKSFRPAACGFSNFRSSKNLLIERAGGFLPPAHIPRCSLAKVFFIVCRQTEPAAICGRRSVSKKSFRPAACSFSNFRSSKNLLIERAGGFLPPAHIPRCSLAKVFFIVCRQTEPAAICGRLFMLYAVHKRSAGSLHAASSQRASQSFPAHRRENKVQSAKTGDMRLGFCTAIGPVCAFGVRAVRCKVPFDQSLL